MCISLRVFVFPSSLYLWFLLFYPIVLSCTPDSSYDITSPMHLRMSSACTPSQYVILLARVDFWFLCEFSETLFFCYSEFACALFDLFAFVSLVLTLDCSGLRFWFSFPPLFLNPSFSQAPLWSVCLYFGFWPLDFGLFLDYSFACRFGRLPSWLPIITLAWK